MAPLRASRVEKETSREEDRHRLVEFDSEQRRPGEKETRDEENESTE